MSFGSIPVFSSLAFEAGPEKILFPMPWFPNRVFAMIPLPQSVSQPDLIPARILNEHAYCPRLAWYEWIQAQFTDNADTVDGTFQHRRVNLPDRKDFDPPEIEEEPFEPFHARSVMLSSLVHGIIAKMDLLEIDGSNATPVEYKRGKVPDVPHHSYEPERVQVTAQALVLRENGYTVTEGIIYYIASKTRVTVPITQDLIDLTLGHAKALREMAVSDKIPLPLQDSPKCPRCSLVGICLPDETNWLIQHPQKDTPTEDKVRRLVPARDDREPAYILAQGAQVGKSDTRLIVRLKGETLREIKLHDLSQLSLFGNVQITAQALREVAMADIPIAHLSQSGWFYATTQGFGIKNIQLRILQFQAAADPAQSLALAKSFIQAKIKNQRTLLRRNSLPDASPPLDLLAQSIDDAGNASSLESLLGIEGNAARHYFQGFGQLLTNPETFLFLDRNRRPPKDPINATLSFLYAMLIKEVHITLTAVGFDPLCGFFHQPRWGKPALALDLAEEFRPLLADSTALTLINTGELQETHFIRRAGSCAFTEAGKKRVITGWERRLDKLVTHPLFDYAVSYRRILEIQARLLSRVIMGEIATYPGFTTR